MKTSINRFLTTLFTIALFATPQAPVLASHQGDATNYLPTALNQWTSYGTTNVSGDSVRLTGGSSGWVYVDIDASKLSGSHIAVAAHVKKTDARNLSRDEKARSAKPYIYVYYMDGDNRMKKYLTADWTMFSDRDDADSVVYGTFTLDSNIKKIRVFLMQSNIKHLSNIGADATFFDPVLLSASSSSNASRLVSRYAEEDLEITNVPAKWQARVSRR